jgi:hypothetical protein
MSHRSRSHNVTRVVRLHSLRQDRDGIARSRRPIDHRRGPDQDSDTRHIESHRPRGRVEFQRT